MTILPQTKAGIWALVLLGASVLLYLAATVGLVGMLRQTGGNTFFDNPLLGSTMFLVVACALASGVVALVAATKYKDRGLLVYIPLAFGLFALFLAVGELAFPY